MVGDGDWRAAGVLLKRSKELPGLLALFWAHIWCQLQEPHVDTETGSTDLQPHRTVRPRYYRVPLKGVHWKPELTETQLTEILAHLWLLLIRGLAWQCMVAEEG